MLATPRATLSFLTATLLLLALSLPAAAQYEMLYEFDLDSDPGWAREGEWAFGQPGGQGGELYGNADPAEARTGSYVFGVNLAGDFATTDDPQAPPEQFGRRFSLVAGPFDLSDYRGGVLSFRRWLNCDRLPFTTATVAVSTDAANWTKVWQSEPEGTDDYSWRTVDYDISFVADYQHSVYLRWDYQTGPLAYPHSGWNLDDIEIWGIHDPQQLQMDSGSDLSATGPAGGPFTGATNLYTFHNEGEYSLSWTAGADVDWLTFSPAGGLLGSGKSVTVSVALNTQAQSLPAGTHQGTISFTDQSNGKIQNYRATLVARPATQLVFAAGPDPVQRSGQPLSLRLVALDAGGALVTAFDAPLTLGASDAAITIENNGPAAFSGGVWEGQLTLGGHAEGLTLHAEAGTLAADTAAFTLERYHLVQASAGAGGEISPAGQTDVLEGTSLDFLLQPAAGYRVAELLLDGQSLGCVDGYCLENIAAPHSLEARFELLPPPAERLVIETLPARLYSEQPFAVRVTATDNAGAAATEFAEPVAFAAQAPGVLLEVVSGPATFAGGVWEGTLQLKGRADTLTLDATAGALAASSNAFELVRLHKVKSLAAAGGGIQPSGEIEVEEGDAIQFSVIADEGYELTDILLDGVPQGPIRDFELSQILSDHEVQAVFAPEAGVEIYTLDCQSPHFTITLDPAKPLYADGEQVTITLEPIHPGYRFTGWSGDATGADPVLTLTMDGNKTIEPLFEAQVAAAAPAWALYR